MRESIERREHYGELKKAFGDNAFIIEKVGKDSIEVEGNNRSQRFRYMGDVENPCPTCTIMVGLSVI